jgi:hypothetical protein
MKLVSALTGFDRWRMFDKVLAWTPLRVGILSRADLVRRVGGAPF